MRQHIVPFIIMASVLALGACGQIDEAPTAQGTGGKAGTGGSSGTGGHAGTGGSGATGGTGGVGGSSGTGGSSATGGTGGSSATGGTGGSAGVAGEAGSAGAAGAGCLAPNPNGAVEVEIRVEFYPDQLPATFHDDFEGGWTAEPVTTASPGVVAEFLQPGIHKLNATLQGGHWLVEGLPTLTLTVPEEAVWVRFGCGPWVHPKALGAVASLGYGEVGYAYREAAGNLFLCVQPAGCSF